MADVKFTGLPAGVGIPNNGSLVAISAFDGAATYVSSKYTMTQLKDIVYVMEAEDKIVFDSSGTNKTFATNGTATYNFDGGVMELSTDASAYGTGAGQLYLSPVLTGGGTFFGADPMFWGFANADFFNGANAVVPAFALEWSGVTNSGLSIFSADNSSNAITGKAADSNIVLIGGNANIGNSGVTNSVILGGLGVIADKDDYAFAQNLEVQGGTLNMTAESKITFDSTGTNKTFVENSSGNQIIMDADLITISTDGDTYLEGWLDISPTFADLAYGTDNSEVLLTNFNAKIKVNNVTLIEGTTTGLGFFNATPVAQPTGVAVSAAGIHAALVSLGLITA